MIFSEFLKKYRKGVNRNTGKALGLKQLSILLNVDYFRLQKWEQGTGTPKDDNDRENIKNFFGIENIKEDIQEDILFKAIQNYPRPHSENPKKVTGEELRKKKALGSGSDDPGLIYVPIAAQAGYSRNFEDPLYVNQLDRLYIPGLPYRGDRYRYFDVEGDSMYPTFEEGMQVIGELVNQEDWKYVSDYYIYVVIIMNRIMIKRLFKKDEKTLILISDNEEVYQQESLDIEKIKELWLVKRVLDWRMAPPKRFEIKL